MKKIINFMIGNKLAVWILTVLLIIWGMFASTSIKYESIPNISLPTLSVSAMYPNATPEQVADDVSKPLENAISSIEGVDSVSSSSSQNTASITVNYGYDTDLDEAQVALEKVVKSVALPENVETPSVMQFSSSSMPILALSVSTDDGDLKTASKYVEDTIQPALEKIDGVGQLTITGQAAYEIQLTFNEKKLNALNTTENVVTQAIQSQNITNQLGLYTLDNTKKSIVVNDKATSLNDLKNMEIVLNGSTTQVPTSDQPSSVKQATNQTIQLKDVATLQKIENHDSISRVNGKDAVSIQITAAQDANTVDVVNAAKEKFEDLEKENSDLHIDITSDQGQPIEDSINTMLEKAIYGALFAVLVILVFLRNFRSTIISIISIPLSLLTSIAILKSLDMSLNMMTLGALTVAIGRVIDDSIVVVENIYRRMHDKDEKLRGRQLITSATAEMFKPILSSTLVTVAVFTPIIFIDGMVAELFGPFALAMAIALGMSLIVAITLVPIMAHTMFKKEILAKPHVKKENKPKHSRIAIRYGKMLNASLNHKVITFVIALLILIGSVALLPKVGFSFLGSEQQTTMITTYTPATGELDADVDTSVKEAEKYIAKQDGVTLVQSSITSNSSSSASSMSSSGSMLYIIFDEDTKNLATKQQKLFDHLKTFEHKGTWKQQDFSSMGTSNEVSYTISSTDRSKVEKAALQIEKVLDNETDLKDAKSSVSDSYPQYTFNLKQKALKEYGLTASQLSPMLMQATGDTIVTTLIDGDNELNVIVKQDDSKTLTTMNAFLKQTITTQNGDVALSELVNIEKSTTPSSISRQDNKEYATVTAAVKGDDVSAVSARIGKEISDIDFDKGVTLEQGGTSTDIQESFTQLGLAIIAAIFLVYFILVVTFREGLAPFAILFSLPFTLIGAILGLLIADEPFSVSSMLGILMLVGIVVTNAIVLVDRVIHNERSGMTMRESLINAAETRLRPILMTAIATIFALLPLALSSNSGSSIVSQGLGITVVGGLITSTILTLFIVPVVYEGLSKLFKKNRQKTID